MKREIARLHTTSASLLQLQCGRTSKNTVKNQSVIERQVLLHDELQTNLRADPAHERRCVVHLATAETAPENMLRSLNRNQKCGHGTGN